MNQLFWVSNRLKSDDDDSLYFSECISGIVTYLAIYLGLVPMINGINLPYTIPAVFQVYDQWLARGFITSCFIASDRLILLSIF